jgi:hypothetical protein
MFIRIQNCRQISTDHHEKDKYVSSYILFMTQQQVHLLQNHVVISPTRSIINIHQTVEVVLEIIMDVVVNHLV